MTDPCKCNQTYSRRLFIQQGITLASMAVTAPLFIERTARGMMLPLESMLSSRPGMPEDRVLVVVQLGGGNDGLNTVVPYGADIYYRARPAIAIPAAGRQNGALTLDQKYGIGLHPSFSGFKDLMDQGVASIVQGVGYPNPNRSHFTSMDIWHTASTNAQGNGWIGRYFDNTCNGTPVPEGAVSIGRNAPLAMNGQIQKPVSFESAELFRWVGEQVHESLKDPYREITRRGALDEATAAPGEESQLNFLTRTALDAQVSSDRIRAAVAKSPLVQYPGGNLSRQLQIVGAMIRDGLATRVYYVSLGGFDTHANQPNQHGNLMRQLGDSLNAFYRDLKAQGNSSRVLTMVFSEFGRRVAQNASQGTDHGAAAPMFFMGDMVQPGLRGEHPSLTNLDEGDLRYNVDFRQLYASVLEDWMKADSAAILGGRFQKAGVLKSHSTR
ncbi:MAG TPA: DUF1501 domain-containing protein [Phycisphaerales bacterium]|nr:DUF1501 domain-containing protein [Phycisphaerales bacterium]HRQ74715.1 DUF1501 domain-containing protein [Phycisphaerales bacterium]